MSLRIRLVGTFDGNRHVRATLLDAGEEVAQSRPLSPVAGVPRWFRGLIAPDLASVDVVPSGGSPRRLAIRLRTDPANELGEVWGWFRDVVLMLAVFCGLASLLVSWTVGRALRPIARLRRVLARRLGRLRGAGRRGRAAGAGGPGRGLQPDGGAPRGRAAVECPIGRAIGELAGELGLRPAIETLVAFWRGRFPEIAFGVAISADETRLSEALKETAYRVVQEGLANAVRHGQPGRIEVVVAGGPDSILVEVSDDGALQQGASATPGFGLSGMGERVAALDGTLSVESRDGEAGWRVAPRLPLPCLAEL